MTKKTTYDENNIDVLKGLEAVRIQAGDEKEHKANFIRTLDPMQTIAIGQGANDALMMEAARIGICVLSPEGTALETLLKADLVVPDINSALEILLHPIRLKASLRK